MLRRSRRLVLYILLLALVVCVGVFTFLWWRGFFIPGWASWQERVLANDDGADGIVESVVLKDKSMIVYSGGSEVYRSPADWKVQEAVWQDLNGDTGREVVMLCWRHEDAGDESAGLTTKGGIGLKQHLMVFDGATDGMHLLWESAPLALKAAGLTYENGRLIITEPQGRQTLWMWNGEALVPAR